MATTKPTKTAPQAEDLPPTRLRKARLARGWTQTRLSRETGVSRSAICSFEATGSFGPNLAARFARALGVTAEELLKDRRAARQRLAEGE